jgi:hypothetical protein
VVFRAILLVVARQSFSFVGRVPIVSWLQAAFEVRFDIGYSISDEGPQLYVGASLSKQAVAARAGDTPLRNACILLFGEKGFQFWVSDAFLW